MDQPSTDPDDMPADQAEQVALATQEFLDWRWAHPDRIKCPDHKHVPVQHHRNDPTGGDPRIIGHHTDSKTYGRPIRDNPQA